VGSERRSRRRIAAPALSGLEILVLAPLAALLVLVVVPNGFAVEWDCIGPLGVQATRGDSFGRAVAVAGTVGWLAVLIAMLYAHIAERPRVAVLLPLVWFVVLVVGTVIAAAAVGPAPCPS
jgi:hypothetical protein